MRLNDNIVTARDVVFAYGHRIAIDSSTFEIPGAGVTAVIGPNGSGKSTLLSGIAGLIEPSAGHLVVDVGRESIAYVMQSTKVNDTLPVTVEEVVSMGRYSTLGLTRRFGPSDRGAVASAMDRMRIGDIARSHLSELSGGQRQRVFMAQGLAQEHELLLLDEPLTGIDIVTAQAIDEVIHEETRAGRAVVMTTHDLSEAQVADHVILLSRRVVASGAPEEVLSGEKLVEAYGSSLLHVEEGKIFVDDPAHAPASGRHVHRERSIHTESDQSKSHPD